MKLFGEYLVEKNIVSTEQMVAALIRQTSKMPGMAEVAYNKKLLRPDQIFKIMKLQNSSNSGFIEAAKELNIWNDSVETKFKKALEETRTPLVQILVDMEAAKLEVITHALDEFLGDVQDSYKEEVAASTVSAATPAVESIVEPIVEPIAEPALEAVSEPEPAFTPDTNSCSDSNQNYQSYCDQFTEEKKIQIETYLSQLENGGISISVMNSMKDIIQSLSTHARAVQAMLSASVLNGMVSMMEQILKTPATNINEDFITRIGKVNRDAIQFLWTLSLKLKSGTPEESILSEPDMKKGYEAVAAAVEITRFDLNFLA